MRRFNCRVGVLLMGLVLLGVSRPGAADTQLVFSTPPKGEVAPLGKPFYLRLSGVYDTPGRTLRVRVTAPGYAGFGPDRNSAGQLAPHTFPQTVTVVIYGTP